MKLIDKIEAKKGARVKLIKTEKLEKYEFKLQSIWPQLLKVLNWLIRNQVDKAMEIMHLVIRRRKHELDSEKTMIEKQKKLMLEQLKDRQQAQIKKILIEVCCGENSRLTSNFKEKGGEAIRIFLPHHDMSKDYTMKALKMTIEELQQEDFEVKI